MTPDHDLSLNITIAALIVLASIIFDTLFSHLWQWVHVL